MPRSVRSVVVAVLGLASFLGACSNDGERLADARAERRAALDAAYESYGGGALAAEVKKEAAREAPNTQDAVGRELLATLAGAAGEIDRVAYEEQCLSFGRGERPVVLNEKARAHFADGKALDRCKKAAKLDDEVRALEAKLTPK